MSNEGIDVSVKVDRNGRIAIQGTVDGAWFSVDGTAQQVFRITPAHVFQQAEAQLASALHGIRVADIPTTSAETPQEAKQTACGAVIDNFQRCGLRQGHSGRCAVGVSQ